MRKGKTPLRARRMTSECMEPRQLLAADLGTNLDAATAPESEAAAISSEFPTIDGTGNNLAHPDWGAAGTPQLRLASAEYADGLGEPSDENLPSAREVSNVLSAQTEPAANDRLLTDFVWLWGQFVDHDIVLTNTAESAGQMPIEVPAGDEYFDPQSSGESTIGFTRSEYVADFLGVRQQINSITAYLDGSAVYGSDAETAAALRSFEEGRLRTSNGDLLPVSDGGFFVAGDVRANENVALTAMHTVWVREHNRWANEIAAADPTLSDEEVFQQARAIVVAEIQAITYNQWLPALLGVGAMDDYAGYDPEVNPSVANSFAAAAYRFGHSMLSSELQRVNADGSVASEGPLALADAFFSPREILNYGVDSLLLGAASHLAQEVDTRVVDDVRNFLFGPPGSGGLDLAALNIQRGRDHGLADYNQTRVDFGLARVNSFSEITSDRDLTAKLEQLYGTVDSIDLWVGVLAEDHALGSSLGELGGAVISDQFTRIRDGDRFWYENRFSGERLAEIRATTLSDVLLRNTELDGLRENVFFDDSMLFFSVDAAAPRSDMKLTAAEGELRLLDLPTGRVLASVPVESAQGVVVVGASGDDRIVVDQSLAAIVLPGGVTLDAGNGGRDEVVLPTRQILETASADQAFAQMGETPLQFEDVERLVVAKAPRPRDAPRPRERRDREQLPGQTPAPPLAMVAQLDVITNPLFRESDGPPARGQTQRRIA